MTDEPEGGQSRPCPSCGEPVWPADNFCESCRAVLTSPGVSAVGAPSPVPVCPHCQSASISSDGYCESCGHKMPAARDHAEINLGQLAGVTDRGVHHYRNEDALALSATKAAAGPVSIAVVCDGVSGSDRGDEASQVAVEAALAVLEPAVRAGLDEATASTQAVQAAQKAVAGLTGPPESSMAQDAPSATFVSAIITPDAVTVCWLGDSRAYWLADGNPPTGQQLTTDDSLATELVSAGVLSAEEAPESPQAHVVTGWLGADVSTRSARVLRFVPPSAGAVLLCSDGLWNYLPDSADLAARAMPTALADPLGTARMLVEFALQAGGRDNITVVIAPFSPATAATASCADPTSVPPTQPGARSDDE